MKINNKEELIEVIKKEIEKQGKVKLDLNHLDVSKVEDFSRLFTILDLGADLEELNVSAWDTSSATKMYCTFGGCNILKKLDLSGWDVSKVNDMSEVFAECWELESAGISGWNVSSVKDMRSMFEGCTLLNEDISDWDVSEVRDVYCMFSGCESFYTDLSDWITWYEEALSDLGAFEECPDYRSMFNVDVDDDYEDDMEEDDYDEDMEEEEDAISESNPRYLRPKTKKELISVIKREVKKQPGIRLDLNHIDVSEITDMSCLFYDSISKSIEELLIDKWDVSKVTNMSSMFEGCLSFNSDLSKWDTSSVTNMNYMFYGCKNFNSDISGWDVSKVTDFRYMFYRCKSFKSDLTAWNVSETALINGFLSHCPGFDRLNSPKKSCTSKKPGTLKELREIVRSELDIQGPNADLNHIDISEITELTGLFNQDVENIKIDKWNTSKVTNMSGLFNGCGKFNADLSNWDTSNVTRMASMFFSCQEFNSDLSGWNVSNVTNVSGMFFRCKKFNSDISGWDLKNVKEALCMLSGCDSFTYSIKHWKLGKLSETETENLVFGREKKNSNKDIKSGEIVIKVTNKEKLREQIKKAIDEQGPNVNLNHLDVSEITDMSELFVGLTVCWIGFHLWDVSKVTTMKAMFKGCNCLYTNTFEYWNVSKVTDMSEMFSGCTNFRLPIDEYWKVDKDKVNTDKMFENSGVR